MFFATAPDWQLNLFVVYVSRQLTCFATVQIGNIISGLHQVVLAKDDRQSREKLLARYSHDRQGLDNFYKEFFWIKICD